MGKRGPDADLEFPLALGEVVDEVDLVAGLRQGHGGRPAQVAVATEDQDALGHAEISGTDMRGVAARAVGESSMGPPEGTSVDLPRRVPRCDQGEGEGVAAGGWVRPTASL